MNDANLYCPKLKHHSEEDADGGWFHLYRDCFDEDNEIVYLELVGVLFETVNSADLSEKGPSRVAIRIPQQCARKLGLLDGTQE